MTRNQVLGLVALLALFYYLYSLSAESSSIGPQSTYVPNSRSADSGFVKPEQRLFKIFSSMSSSPKIRLGGVCEEMIYDKNTVPVILKERMVSLVKRMLSRIQQIMKQEYYMKGIENVYWLRDKRGNERYIVDFFIYDVRNYYTLRLLTDIVSLDGTLYLNYLNVQKASSPTLLNHYDIKFNAEGILFGYNMFHENMMMLFDNYYLKNFKVIGVSDSTLEYSKEEVSEVMNLDSFVRGYYPSNLSEATVDSFGRKGFDGYLEMYVPEHPSTLKDPLFCKKYKQEWDEYGIPKPQEVPPTCLRDNLATIAKLNDPWFGPGLIYQRTSHDEHRWLKNRGNISNAL